jgi:hypothetical protein
VSPLPGNVASSDPYGLSTSSSLTLRGLGQDEIGVLMEGAPQNDIGYYAYPSQFADAEKVRPGHEGAVDLARRPSAARAVCCRCRSTIPRRRAECSPICRWGRTTCTEPLSGSIRGRSEIPG